MEESTTVSIESTTVSTEYLREKIRKYARQQREQLRATASDTLRFGLGDLQVEELEQLHEKDIKGLAGRIKRRKHATEDDMYRLCHAFLQSEANIVAFANSGAIPVIVKELTGHDGARQIAAAECLCNLALGQSAIGDKIVNLAGSYLVMHLDSMEERLKRTCLWTLANILATGGKGSSALMQMELLPKLWPLYVADNGETAEDYRTDAAICLQLISLRATTLLRPSDRVYLRQHISDKNPTCTAAEYHLQIVFNCDVINASSEPEDERQLLYLINFALSDLRNTLEYAAPQRTRVLYAVRVLANLLATHTATYGLLLQQLANVWQTNLVECLNAIFACNDAALCRETLWLLRNLLQMPSGFAGPSLLDKLRIPRNIDCCAAVG